MVEIMRNDFRYPALLKEIDRAPSRLYCYGDVSFLSMKSITIVGTRKITDYGIKVINSLLPSFLSKLDVVIVSGLALGVDAEVHRVCLRRGIKTLAIVPGGICTAIPKANMGIYNLLRKKGLILAEFPERVKLHKGMYSMRNRLLAGISNTTILIEAGLNSGSLHTARYALEYGRDIYVVPGRIDSVSSQGCNMLLAEGAEVVRGVNTMKEILSIREEQLLLK